jgi:hypothetical protein
MGGSERQDHFLAKESCVSLAVISSRSFQLFWLVCRWRSRSLIRRDVTRGKISAAREKDGGVDEFRSSNVLSDSVGDDERVRPVQ